MSDRARKADAYRVLNEEAEANRRLYDETLDQLKGIQSAATPAKVRIVEPAHPPTAPYKPDIHQFALFGLIAGLFSGLFIILCQVSSRARSQK
jgi:uncharacterized protein involved in exopolysaccharide biosynthesis